MAALPGFTPENLLQPCHKISSCDSLSQSTVSNKLLVVSTKTEKLIVISGKKTKKPASSPYFSSSFFWLLQLHYEQHNESLSSAKHSLPFRITQLPFSG